MMHRENLEVDGMISTANADIENKAHLLGNSIKEKLIVV
jgi:hypothetical protein